MYCSNCGAPAAGNFCSGCGNKLSGGDPAPAPRPVARPVSLPDWRDEVRYEFLVKHPEVRDRIARSAKRAAPGVSGEKWLELFDKLAGSPVPLKAVAAVAQPLYARLGVSTGQVRDRSVRARPGEVLAAVLCSLARNGQEVTDVRQAADGCSVEAVFPSDLFALAGTVIVSVRQAGRGTHVEAATTVPGQWFDWGKGRRWLDRLFDELDGIGERAAA